MNVHSQPFTDPDATCPSPSPADQRSAEILASVRQAFVEKGFDGASMQDLARAAGMSVGNFYRYFPSKAAIIKAMIEVDLAEIQRDFATILGSRRPDGDAARGHRATASCPTTPKATTNCGPRFEAAAPAHPKSVPQRSKWRRPSPPR